MKKVIFSFVVATLATGVYAQTSQFEGVSLGLGIGAVGASTKASVDDSGKTSVDLGKTSVVPAIDLSYSKSIDSNFLLGVGVTYDLGKTKSGETSSADVRILGLEGKNHYSVYLQPQYLVSNSTALFAKVGYHSMKGQNTGDIAEFFTSEKYHGVKYHGVGYGVGVKSFLNKNLFVQAEAQLVNYSEKSFDYGGGVTASYKPKTASGIVTLGYKF